MQHVLRRFVQFAGPILASKVTSNNDLFEPLISHLDNSNWCHLKKKIAGKVACVI